MVFVGWGTLTLHKVNDLITQCDSVNMACGEAPTRHLHSILIAVAGSGHTGKQINLFDAVIHMQESPPHTRSVLGASNVCLVGENPTCSVPAL